MNKELFPKPVIWALIVLVLVQLACGLGSGNTVQENAPDYAATESALQATQSALDAQAQQPTATTPPQPTPTEEPVVAPTDAPPPTEEGPITYESGDVIYYTDFLGAEDWEDGWVHFPIPEADYTVFKDNDFMHVEVPETLSTVYLVYDDLYLLRDQADVWVETSFRNLSTHNINQVGVMCRASVDGWYEFNLLSGGLWYIWKYDGNTGDYNLLNNGGIAKLDYDAPHTIAASCVQDQLAFYLDGELIKNSSIKDSTFREGRVGISVFADDQWPNVVIEFDYFGVQVP